jgi:hypothetical protein
MRQRQALRPRLLLSVDLCVLAPLRLCVLLLHPFDLAKQLPSMYCVSFLFQAFVPSNSCRSLFMSKSVIEMVRALMEALLYQPV